MHRSQQAAFLDCVAPLLESPQVQSMKQWRHHFSITCYEHSLFVSYTAFRLARRFGWDERAAVNVLAASPYAIVDSERRKGYRVMTADVRRDLKLKNCAAALIADV